MSPYVESASRMELVVRWLYGIVIGVIFYFWAIYVGVVEFIQFFHILIYGRRGLRLYRATLRFLAAYTNAHAYLGFLTDQRPELTPDLIVYFRKPSSETPTDAKLVVAETKYCASCGTKLQRNEKYCGNCGAKQI
jgi:hypothetical protein